MRSGYGWGHYSTYSPIVQGGVLRRLSRALVHLVYTISPAGPAALLGTQKCIQLMCASSLSLFTNIFLS